MAPCAFEGEDQPVQVGGRAHTEVNAAARVAALGARAVPTTAIVVQTLSGAWLVEIEVVAAA